MTFGDKIFTAWSNLGRRKVRTILTSTGVVVGILTIIVLVSLAKGAQLSVRKQFEEIGLDRVVARPPSDGDESFFNPFGVGERTKLITPQIVDEWKKWPQVLEITPEIELPQSVRARVQVASNKTLIRINGTQSLRRRAFGATPHRIAGTLELPPDGAVVLSQGAIKKWKLKNMGIKALVGQNATVTLLAPRGETQNYTLRIVGVSDEKAPRVQVGAQTQLKMKSWWLNEPDLLKTDGYDAVNIRTPDVTQAKELVTRLKRDGWQVQSIESILNIANRIFSVLTMVLGLVGGVALFVACIGIANTMLMSVYERTREIGIFKAMGASSSDIRTIFVFEAAFIGLLGGVAGLLLSVLMTNALNSGAHWFARRQNLPVPEHLFVLTPLLALQALAFAVFIGIIAGWLPANRAAKLDPLTALRHE